MGIEGCLTTTLVANFINVKNVNVSKEINALIYSLALNKIDWVYFVEDEYYRIYLHEEGKILVRINLTRGINRNFSKTEESRIILPKFVGGKKRIRPLEALKLFNNCSWKYEPNYETLDIVKTLLEIVNFKEIKKKITESSPFFFWLKKQVNRDDLIGDIAYDVHENSKSRLFTSYKELEYHVEFNQEGLWEVNSFKDYKREGSVSPLLYLKLAKLEYDLNLKKEKLKRFKIRNTEGYVYFLKPENTEGPIKIGRAKDINQRISQLQTSLPYDLKLIGKIESDDYIELEKTIHNDIYDRQVKREWFDITIDEAIKIITSHSGQVKDNNQNAN